MITISDYLYLLTSWPSIICLILIAVYFYSTRNHNFWKSKGIDGPKPLPFIGTIHLEISKPQILAQKEIYNKFGKIHGLFLGQTPILVISDPEILKNIYVKDFSSFHDRGLPSFGHPIFDRSLLNVDGDQWKQTRVIVSPTFSSGKMKKLHVLIEECVKRLDQALEKLVDTEIDVRKVIANYTMDVISFCAFATKIDTHNTGPQLHPFIEKANELFNPGPRFVYFSILSATVPSLVKKFNLAFVRSTAYKYFEQILKQIISEREKLDGTNYNDFLQLLIDAKDRIESKDIDEDIRREVQQISESMQKKNFRLEEIDILATSLLFILAGSETTSATLSLMIHELTLRPEYQDRLYEEIKSCGDKLDYDTISQLPYLNACVSETLRKYPPIFLNQRKATEDYEFDFGLKIKKSQVIRIPIYSIHHDPKNFPDPEQFQPDRFMPENKSKIIPYTYLPFGSGPRNCVGNRFAFMNIKTAAVHILSKYRFIQTPNTLTQFEYKKFVFSSQPISMGTIGLSLRK